jgi:hypothetical protein
MRAEARLAPPWPILSERLQEEALATSKVFSIGILGR